MKLFAADAPPAPVPAATQEELRARLRNHLVSSLGPEILNPFSPLPRREQVIRAELHRALVEQDADPDLTDQLYADLVGLGPLTPLMADREVTDILVNRFDEVFVERRGRLERTEVRFRDQAHLEQMIQKLVAMVGREINLDRPVVDARMPDGSRANAVFAPVGGPTLCIRKFNRLRLDLLPAWHVEPGLVLTSSDSDAEVRHSDWVTEGGLSLDMARLLVTAARCRANVLVAGSTGAGKSTLLRSFVSAMPAEERVITIEDTAELELDNPHWVRLEVVHGAEAGRDHSDRRLSVADLVQNALRMRPDRLVIGEIRHSREALYTLEAMNTGHDGSVTTIHASSAADALARLELLVARDFGQLRPEDLRAHIARVVDLVIFVARTRFGQRAVMEIAEVDGLAGGDYRLRPAFAAEATSERVLFRPVPGYNPGPRLQARMAQAGLAWEAL